MWKQQPTRSIIVNWNLLWSVVRRRWVSYQSKWWPTVTTPITRPYRLQQHAGSTFMVHGRRRGGRENAMLMAAAESLSAAHFLTMLSTMSTFVRLANGLLSML